MNKVDFARRLATRLQISNYESIDYLNAVIKELETVLSEGEPISFQQFGTFAPWYQPARPGRNPQNGDPHLIPARTSVKFKAGKGLLKKMNGHLLSFLSALLLTLCGSSCTAELPTTDANNEWLPIEINQGVVGMTIASSDTRAETVTLPTIVKTAFENGDEIKLTINESGGMLKETVTLVYNGSKWLERTTTGDVEFIRKKDYDRSIVIAEYGTKIESSNTSTTDYLKTDTPGSITFKDNVLKCNLTFDHQYPCIEICSFPSSNTLQSVSFGGTTITNNETVFANMEGFNCNQITLNYNNSTKETLNVAPQITFEKNKYYQFNIYLATN